MRISKNINIAEYQKCGELMVAVKKNKFAMCCKFCQQLFTQLQAFMRHLQLQHNDKLEFVKESKKVEVYAVEELMNQTAASTMPEIESEESNMASEDDCNWLTEQDMKWLKNGEEPAKKELIQTKFIKNVEQEEVEDLGLANMSILKALEDCDVSFNLMDALNSTKCAEDKKDLEDDTNLNNTLLREIENEWNDSDSNDSEPKKIDCSIADLANVSKRVLDLGEELDLDVTMTEVINQSIVLEENPECVDIEKSPCKKIKNLLEGLDDLEDIDSLLENLEGAAEEEIVEKEEDNKMILLNGKLMNKTLKNESPTVSENKDIEKTATEEEILENELKSNKKILLNGKIINKTLENDSATVSENKDLEEIESKTLNDFERRLKQLEEDLDDDNDIMTKIEPEKCKANKDFAAKLKDLENSLNDFEPKENIRENNELLEESNNFELQLKHLENSLNEDEIEKEICNKIVNKKINALNDDVTKALADALDDNLELLALQAEDDNEEPLNQDLLNLLDQELNDNEIEQDSVTLNKIINFKVIEELKEDELTTKIGKKIRKSLTSPKTTIVKTKYQKTNLKAKCKLRGTQNNDFKTSEILKECNVLQKSDLNTKLTKNTQVPFKAKHNVFPNQEHLTVMNMLLQKPINSLKSPVKTLTKIRSRKTPNKENQENKTPALHLLNIKKEKLTPVSNFINTDRGDKTPLKQERIFLKQSPKTQEKQESLLENKTPKRQNKTPQSKVIKQSPKTQEKVSDLNLKKTPTTLGNKQITPPIKRNLKQTPKSLEKQENLLTQQTPSTTKQKTPPTKANRSLKQTPKTQEKLNQTSTNKSLKQSPKTQEKPNQTPTNKTPKTPENLTSPINKETKNKSLKKSPPKSNEKLAISPKKCHENSSSYKDLKTPLTTPQRLRNVAIKLQRFTPDKLSQKPRKLQAQISPQKSIDQETKQIMEHFKLPQGIILTKIPSNTTEDKSNQSEIIETPIKPTYCKQNFNESTLETLTSETEVIPKKNPLDILQQTTSLIQPQSQIINNLKTESLISKIRQRKASIDIIPPTQNNQQQPSSSSATNKTPRHSNLDYKSYAVNRSARKKEVLQRMRHIKKQIFKSIENGECVTKKIQRLKSPLVKPQRKRKILIENIQILPNLEKDALTPLINPFNNFKKPNTDTPNLNTISPKNLADDQKQAKINSNSYKLDSSINDDEKLIKKSLKRPATSPLANDDKPPAKRIQKSPLKDGNQLTDKAAGELEATQLDLSESVVDFLQRDLKANRLNVESFLNEELPVDDIAPDETSTESNIKESKTAATTKDSESTNNSNLIDDLLNQVDNEKQTKEEMPKDTENANDETLKDDDTNIDFDEEKDISLLDKVGLKIIKCPDIEDTICLEERDKNMEKAKKFANLFKNWPRIWCTKNAESPKLKQELEISFNQLLNDLNLSYNLRLTLTELKRLVNLINLWYGHNINNRLIEKRKIHESTNRYLIMFHFIPKTAKRFCYCEYCDDYFNTEHKYFTHRIVHTGALHPYSCRNCSTGFRNVKQLKTHEDLCKKTDKCHNLKSSQNTYDNPRNRIHKCEICLETFNSSDILYEHSKKHLKTIYNCAKCELVFASALDVQIHMSTCNTVTKRMPKQCTPRPAKTKP